MKINYNFTFTFLLFIMFWQSGNIIAKANPDFPDTTGYSKLVQDAFEEMEIPGMVVGIWSGDSPVMIKTYGVSDINTQKPISKDDHFRIGSNTKTFTGTVLLQLVDEGKLSLTDKVSKYFPYFPNGDNITISMLGQMRSGIFNYTEDSAFVSELMGNFSLSFTPDKLISIALEHQPYFPPGTDFHYSNTNTVMLGIIIEQLTGNSLGDEFQKESFTPLGMSNTYFPLDATIPDPHSNGYMYKDTITFEIQDVTIDNVSWGWAAGAIISTVEDLNKYAKKMATGELISKSSQAERVDWGETMSVPSGVWKDIKMSYGFALADFGGAYGHNGGLPGYNSFMGYIPEKDLTIIILANMQENKDVIGPADYTARKIVEKVMGQ